MLRMKVVRRGLLLAVRCAPSAYLAMGCSSSSESQASAANARVVEPATQATPEDVASFLRRVGPTFQEANSACFAAEQCGSLERAPKRGALASADQMPACLKERVPTCSALAEKLTAFVPPSAIAALWGGALQFRVSRPLKHSLLTSQLVIEANGPPAMTIPANKSYADVEDWVAKQQMPIAAKYAALRSEAEQWQQDTVALDEWVRVNNICSSPGVRCTLDRALGGR
jgi:hypothetical protein